MQKNNSMFKKLKIKKKKKKKTPQNYKSPTQSQRFMTTIKNPTEEKEQQQKKAENVNWISQCQ